VAGRLVATARAALPTAEAAVARQVLAADLALPGDLDAQIGQAEARLAALLPVTEYAVVTSVPGWEPSGSRPTPPPWAQPADGPPPGRSTGRPG
jgi:hypothetical protein